MHARVWALICAGEQAGGSDVDVLALGAVGLCRVPGEQQGGARAQRADQVHGQLPPLVVGQ